MKRIFALLTVLFFISVNCLAETINKSCTSKSGKSIYDISFNTIERSGEIRYRFFDQDVFYSVQITSINGNKIQGIAEFKDSRSGETRGKSWVFTYEKSKQTLMDNHLEALCK